MPQTFRTPFLLADLPSCLEEGGRIDLGLLERVLITSQYARDMGSHPLIFGLRGFEGCQFFFHAEDREGVRQAAIAWQRDVDAFDASAFIPGDRTFEEAVKTLSEDIQLYRRIALGLANGDSYLWRDMTNVEERLWALLKEGGDYAPIPWFTSSGGSNHKFLQLQLPDKVHPLPLQTFVEVKCIHNTGLDPR